MGQRNHAVDVGVMGQRLGVGAAREMVGNRVGDGGRTVHAGQHADVVARCHAAVRARYAHEHRFARRCGRLEVGAKGVVAFKVALVRAHVQVVRVHVFAGRDIARGKADDLVVAAHWRALAQRVAGDLVAWWYQASDHQVIDVRAGDQLGARNQYVVIGVQSDARCHVVSLVWTVKPGWPTLARAVLAKCRVFHLR